MMEPLYMNWLTLLLNIVVIGVSQKHFASNRNSSNKGRITFQKHITYVERIMRFFVKKSQKEKKSQVYISVISTLCIHTKNTEGGWGVSSSSLI